MRILLVEDDPMLGDGLAAGLRQSGFAVDWLKDGDAANAALKCEPFDMMVLDLGLPKMSGMDVLRRLRDRGSCRPGRSDRRCREDPPAKYLRRYPAPQPQRCRSRVPARR